MSLIALIYCESSSIYTPLPLSHGQTAKPSKRCDNGTIPPLDCDSDGRPDPRAYSEVHTSATLRFYLIVSSLLPTFLSAQVKEFYRGVSGLTDKMTTLEEANVVDDLKVAKDLFSGAVGGIAQVLIGEYFHLLVYVFGCELRASLGP